MRNPSMVGDRVYLRPLEPDDADALAAASVLETDTVMDRGRVPVSPLAFAHWLEHLDASSPPHEVHFAVCLRGDPDPDRTIGLVNIEHLDWINRTGETGSGIFPASFRGQGYGTEAKRLLLTYAFDRLLLHALHSYVWEPNHRSAAALRKQGYRLAGRIQWTDVKDGCYRDTLVFDLLRDDWLAAKSRAE